VQQLTETGATVRELEQLQVNAAALRALLGRSGKARREGASGSRKC